MYVTAEPVACASLPAGNGNGPKSMRSPDWWISTTEQANWPSCACTGCTATTPASASAGRVRFTICARSAYEYEYDPAFAVWSFVTVVNWARAFTSAAARLTGALPADSFGTGAAAC